MKDAPAYDQIIQGLSGVMSITGDERCAPLRVGYPVADTIGGITAAFAIAERAGAAQRTGEGAFIDVSMLDSALATWAGSCPITSSRARSPPDGQRELHGRALGHVQDGTGCSISRPTSRSNSRRSRGDRRED